MSDQVLRDEIQKRLTLNWLIQGAAQHAGMTSHHLVRDELNALEPELLRLYDQFALVGILHYWRAQAAIIFGSPPRFWKRAASDRTHPFFGHLLFTKYGGMLAEAARQRAVGRCKEKGVTRLPFAFSFQTALLIIKLRKLETPHRPRLVQLAKEATSMVWGIPFERLGGWLGDRIVPAGLVSDRSFRGIVLRCCVLGCGGVVQRGGTLMINARATNWHLLTHELVKGTAELICLHGLNQLSEDIYQRVIHKTDRLELEPWMLQSGGELWRRMLAVIPEDRPLAHVLMHLARLPAAELESVIVAAIEKPGLAQIRLAELVEENQ